MSVECWVTLFRLLKVLRKSSASKLLTSQIWGLQLSKNVWLGGLCTYKSQFWGGADRPIPGASSLKNHQVVV